MPTRAPYAFISHASADNARLRPVLVALLEAGVPIWFDRPYQDDILVEDRRFSGYINGGTVWSSTIDDVALPESSAFLVFPSEDAAKSHNVTHEIFSALQRHRATGNRYFVATLLLDSAARVKTHGQVKDFQDYKTFTENKDGAGWGLTASGVEAAARLARELKAKFEEFATTPLSKVETGWRSENDSVYLVDRVPQTSRAVLALSGVVPLAPQPLLFAYGRIEEEHRCFGAVTMPRRVIGGIMADQSSTTRTTLALEWPDAAPVRQHEFDTLLTHSICQALQGVSVGVGKTLAQSRDVVAALLAQEGVARIACCSYGARFDRLDDFIKRLQMWCAYWHEFPFDAARANGRLTLLPVLEICFDGRDEKQLRSEISRAHDAGARNLLKSQLQSLIAGRDIRRWLTSKNNLARACVPYPKIQPHALDEFTPVERAHVIQWVKSDETVFGALSQTDRANLERELQSVFGSSPSLFMRDWAERARPIMRERII